PQGSERFLPYQQSSLGALFGKNKLPVIVAQSDQVGVIVKVVELLARTLLRLAGQEWQHVVAVEMHLKVLVTGFHSFEELLLHIGNARRRKERGQHVEVRYNAVLNRAGFDMAGPLYHASHPIGTFPVPV